MTAVAAWLILLALVCTIGGATLAMVDAAYAASSRSELDELGHDYPRVATSLQVIREDLDRHLIMLHFVRATLDTFAAVFMTVAIGSLIRFEWVTLLIAALTIALVNMVVVGISPKKIGERSPRTVIRRTAWLVRTITVVLAPLSQPISLMGERMFASRAQPQERMKSEQLFSLVDRAAEQDLLEEAEQNIIHSVVEFSDTLVREVMIPRTDMVTVETSATIEETLAVMLQSRFSRIPVISGDSDSVVGVAYFRDIVSTLFHKGSDKGSVPVTRYMKPARFVPDLQRTDDLLRQMQREANHLAVAVDEYGGIAGLVTMEDLIEELIGDIHDEHDRAIAEVTQLDNGSFLISARMDIEDLGQLFNTQLDDDEVETVAGLVAKKLGRLAERGDVVTIAGIELTVGEIEKKRQRLNTVVARWVGEVTDRMNVTDEHSSDEIEEAHDHDEHTS